MAGEIKRINSIKNMAVFQSFNWSNSVRDKSNNIAEFRKLNVLYGRNYSGKTTLSRIFRALETQGISDKYISPEFNVSFDGVNDATQNDFKSHGQLIRVFNEDFVKENLRFIVDDGQPINSFAILGEDNSKVEKEIEKLESELGDEEKKTGLIGEYSKAQDAFVTAKASHKTKSDDLEGKLREKANNAKTGIKHNKQFGEATYNVTRIHADIKKVTDSTYVPIDQDQEASFYAILKEEPKDEVRESNKFSLQYSSIASKAKELVERDIKASAPVQEWLDDTDLGKWVQSGRKYHEEKRDHCAFCGSQHDHDHWEELWKKLDSHFNQESQDMEREIDALIKLVEDEKKRVPELLKIKQSDFYSSFEKELNGLSEKYTKLSGKYVSSLDEIKQQLEKRKNDIFSAESFSEPASFESDLIALRDEYEKIRLASNGVASELGAKQSAARLALRLHEVYTFINDIKYSDEVDEIETLRQAFENAGSVRDAERAKVDTKKSEISELKSKLKDESKGADRVNEYLNDFFGHKYLSLVAIEQTDEEATSKYRFEVMRGEAKAYHLSEGECSLIAFCYFMAKLHDIDTKGNQPIIWIDDPISSLDSNHIFFVYSLINAEIVTPEKYNDNGVEKERDRFKQLFISTHNLDFLKYLKRLPGANQDARKKDAKKKFQYLIIERCDKESSLKIMPDYLREYVTEFNYLFHQIFKCASIETIDDTNYTTFYNFGNNARKFFEVFLYYKYPDKGMNEETLKCFFGDEKIPAVLTDRINNEYSHLCGVFERGATPVEVPEMQTAAKQIMERLKQDEDQYTALLTSIGESAPQPAVPGEPVAET
ncbi:AAA family ATPase [Alcanivorax sp. 1008]|uniref:AAA family ATPase n=1 Tax=Alcanivorax sp. 1008 TaxID=2816853 RepID=UPI001D9AF000|nr:AAA family ATPase [Alcanivorax sp. 1008]MCC1497952.1 AAA family ATPase [Alcanivorax sp. 1008]